MSTGKKHIYLKNIENGKQISKDYYKSRRFNGLQKEIDNGKQRLETLLFQNKSALFIVKFKAIKSIRSKYLP